VTGSPTRLVTFRTGDDVGVGELQEDRARVLAAPPWSTGWPARLGSRPASSTAARTSSCSPVPHPSFRSPDEGEVPLSAGHEA
jgi:uncharacterized protein DUF2437